MPLLDISANVIGLDSPSRKRSHEEFVDDQYHGMMEGKSPCSGVLHHGSVTEPATCELSIQVASSPQAHSSPASLTDSGSTPAMNSPSPNPSPSRRPFFSQPTALSVTSLPPTTPQAALLIAPAPPPPAAATSPATTSIAGQVGQVSSEPPAKRKRLTATEKEEKAKEREQAKAAKLAEKAKLDEEKKVKAEEREKKLKEKEEENRKRTEEKDRKKREKEEEVRKAQEAKEKKERSQLKLASFFKAGPSTPSKKATPATFNPSSTESPQQATSADVTPQKAPITEVPSVYSKIFKPFFVKEHVTLARDAFEMDEAAKELKSRALDEFVAGRQPFAPKSFTGAVASVEYFGLPAQPGLRGRTYPNVRKVMTMLSEASSPAPTGGSSSSVPIDLTGHDSQQTVQIHKTTRDLLKEVPMKSLSFYQDVRPAYYGTITTLPRSGSMRRLARRPMSRELLPLQYDYDSEAEWVDDGDGEDIDDMDDDEEELDEDEDMADFLDDSEDVSLKRPLFASGLEPESSGLCYEDGKRLGPVHRMYKYRMEFIPGEKIRRPPPSEILRVAVAPDCPSIKPCTLTPLTELEHHHSIDPFSTRYWDPEPKLAPAAGTAANASSAPSSTAAAPAGSMQPPPTATGPSSATDSGAPANAFATLAQGGSKKPAALVPTEMMPDLKRAILRFPKLSKVGLVEILSTEFTKCTRAQIKLSIETVAERAGAGRDKSWVIKAEHAV